MGFILVFLAYLKSGLPEEPIGSFDAEWSIEIHRIDADRKWYLHSTVRSKYSVRKDETYFRYEVVDEEDKSTSIYIAHFDGTHFYTKVDDGVRPRVNKLALKELMVSDADATITHPRIFEYWGLCVPRVVKDFKVIRNQLILAKAKSLGVDLAQKMNEVTFDDFYVNGSQIKLVFEDHAKTQVGKFVRTRRGKTMARVINTQWRKVDSLKMTLPFKTVSIESLLLTGAEFQKSIVNVKRIEHSVTPIKVDKSQFDEKK